MYNLIKYSSNYFNTTGSSWFCSKDEATNFHADSAYSNNNNFKSFDYKANLLPNTVSQPAPNQVNGILKNATIPVPFKYLSNFCRSLETTLIICKIQLKLEWKKYCVLAVAVNDNTDANPDNIIFTVKDTKLHVAVLILSAKDNQKLLKLHTKRFEKSVYWDEYKTKSENKNTTNEDRIILCRNYKIIFFDLSKSR